jgi:hypothetical protein
VLLFASVSGRPDSDAAVTTAEFDHHVAILANLGVSSRRQAASVAVRLGIGSSDSDAAVTTAEFDHHVAILAKLVSSRGQAASVAVRSASALSDSEAAVTTAQVSGRYRGTSAPR